MALQSTPYTLPLVAAALVMCGLLVTTIRSRDKRGAVPLSGVLLGVTVWTLGDAAKLTVTDQSLKILANNVRFFGPFITTTSVLLFAAEYTNREKWLERRRVAGLFAFHAVSLVLLWTNPWHHLVRESVSLYDAGGDVLMETAWGPWYFAHAAYSYLLLVVGTGMLVDNLRRSGNAKTYRRQTVTILIGAIVPWVINIAFVLGVTEVDLTALGFTVTGMTFVIAMFRYEILDLVPIARSTVVDNINEGYLVLDPEDTVVDVNGTAAEIIGRDREEVVGERFQSIFRDFPTVIEGFADAQDIREQISLVQGGDVRHYDVNISPIYDDRDKFTGRVVLFRDITARVNRKQQLEQQKTKLEHQNERLEDFASIVSHDLRNPINVVRGRAELAQDQPEDRHFEEINHGLDRMEAIIDDVLEMARQGQTVEETERVPLAEVCEEAWSNVDTRAATLTVDTTRTIRADRTRLLQVFENLFRNAIDHGGVDVAVTVGNLSDGFYVEDDGPGIPEADRDDVLEKGYTTAKEGTGFGLSIVQTAVEAHGWTFGVTEGSEGGARFEITGLPGDESRATDGPGERIDGTLADGPEVTPESRID